MKTFYALGKRDSCFIKVPFKTMNEAIAEARSILKEYPMHKLIIWKAVGEIDATVTTNYRDWVKKITEKV